jgi:hypothetical protein
MNDEELHLAFDDGFNKGRHQAIFEIKKVVEEESPIVINNLGIAELASNNEEYISRSALLQRLEEIDK